MKTKTYFNLSIVLLIFCIIFNFVGCENRQASDLHTESIDAIAYADTFIDVNIKSPQSFIYDVSNNKIIYSKGENKVVYPGSISKLLTILYAMEILPLDEVITPTDELDLVKPHSSIAYIKAHHKITVEMLIEGMLLPSGNDAAFVLAAACGKEIENDPNMDGKSAVNSFMNKLNQYGKEIGLCGTNFTVPDGYAGKEHYTTTEDILLISKLAYENETIRKYSKMQKDSVTYSSGHTNDWINTNKLLDPESEFYSKYANGLKTGSIDDEYSLVFTFEFEDGREFIAAVFGSKNKNDRFSDALKIIEKLNKSK